MQKTLLISLLVIVLGVSGYYSYKYFTQKSHTLFNVKTPDKVIKPKHLYRVELASGGTVEGVKLVKSENTITVVSRNGLSSTVDKANVIDIVQIPLSVDKKVRSTQKLTLEVKTK